MPIYAVCPECQSTYDLADDQRGKKVRCKKCQAVFEVGAPAEPKRAEARRTVEPVAERPVRPARKAYGRGDARREDDDYDRDERRRPVKKKGSASPWLIIGGVGAVCVVLLGGVVGIWAIFHYLSKPDSKVESPRVVSGPGNKESIDNRPQDRDPPNVKQRKRTEVTKPPDPPTKSNKTSLAALDLTSGGHCLTVDAPEGATVEPETMNALVEKGQGFSLSVHVKDKISQFILDEARKNARDPVFQVAVDSEDVLVIGIKAFGQEDFHCYVTVRAEEETYFCTDKQGERAFTRAEALQMAECARTLRQTPANKEAKVRMQEAIKRFAQLGCRFKPAFNHLVIDGSDVTDADLSLMKDLPQSTWVIVSASKVTGTGLRLLQEMPHLNSLSLEGEYAKDDWLQALKGLPKLQTLWVQRSSVTDQGLQALSGSVNVRQLRLNDNAIGDKGLEHVGKLTGLTGLDLENTQISDAGLQHLKGLKSLGSLKLSGTAVSDAGLEHLVGLKELFSVDAGDTQVTAAGARKLHMALPKCTVNIQSKK
jgi:predicted Zn finger-like uncharacterized protein